MSGIGAAGIIIVLATLCGVLFLGMRCALLIRLVRAAEKANASLRRIACALEPQHLRGPDRS